MQNISIDALRISLKLTYGNLKASRENHKHYIQDVFSWLSEVEGKKRTPSVHFETRTARLNRNIHHSCVVKWLLLKQIFKFNASEHCVEFRSKPRWLWFINFCLQRLLSALFDQVPLAQYRVTVRQAVWVYLLAAKAKDSLRSRASCHRTHHMCKLFILSCGYSLSHFICFKTQLHTCARWG